MRILTATAALAFAALLASPASAQDVEQGPPYLEAEQFCGAAESEEAELACLADEQAAYDEMSSAWGAVSPSVAGYCADLSAGDMQSYRQMMTCLQSAPSSGAAQEEAPQSDPAPMPSWGQMSPEDQRRAARHLNEQRDMEETRQRLTPRSFDEFEAQPEVRRPADGGVMPSQPRNGTASPSRGSGSGSPPSTGIPGMGWGATPGAVEAPPSSLN